MKIWTTQKGDVLGGNKCSNVSKFLINLHENSHKNEIEAGLWDGLILRYVELDSSEILHLEDDRILKGGAVSVVYGPMGLQVCIFIIKDIVPVKFRRYVCIHETVEWSRFNHWYAVQDEFKAAEEELTKEDFREYCHFRLTMHENDIETIREIRAWVSKKARKVLTRIQREMGIVLRQKK